jgi:hypothetical protein
MRGKKILLIIFGLAILLAVLLLLLRRRNQPAAANVASAPDGSFVMQVEKPLFSLRAPWELPRAIFGDRDPDLRITQTSPGVHFGAVTPNRLELTADAGWDLLIEADGQGQLNEGTRLVFPISFGGGSFIFNCRHADLGIGYYKITPRGDKLDGDFLLRVTQCKNTKSGKNTSGLPPFPVRGSFKGLPRAARIEER